jgi:hypothetical protein
MSTPMPMVFNVVVCGDAFCFFDECWFDAFVDAHKRIPKLRFVKAGHDS